MDSSRQDHQISKSAASRQDPPNSSSPCSSSKATQASSATGQLNEKTGVYHRSNELESQPTIKEASIKDDSHHAVPPIEHSSPERLGQLISRVRPSTWWFLGALLLGIPLILFTTVFSTIKISGIKVAYFITWLEVVWTAGWFARLLIWLVAKGWQKFFQTVGWIDWDDFLLDTAISQLGFILSLVAWGSSWIICSFPDGTCSAHWLRILQKVLLATIPATGIFLVKGLLMEVIITRQASRMVDAKKDLIIRHAKAFEIFVDGITGEESEATFFGSLKLQFNDIRGGGLLLRTRSPAANDYDSKFTRYTEGDGRDEDFELDNNSFVDQMRCQFREIFAFLLSDQYGNIKEVLNEKYFQDMLDKEHIKKLNSSSKIFGTPLTAGELLKILDMDGDEEIRLDELVEAHVETFMALRDLGKSTKGIKRAAKSVNIVVSCILLCIVAILYAAFFTNHLASYLTPIWTTVTGLSFALGGTVTEFITACAFVFSKQPYDIGDRVVVDDKDLIVDEICLLYTIFHRASDGAIEQIAHKKICDSWITNLSRSRGLSVKESAIIPESTDTISRSTLDSYRVALGDFIKQNPVRSRYLNVENVQVSLQTVKDEGKKVVALIKLRELLVRREDILAGVRHEVRDKLEELVRAPLGTG